MDDPRDSVNRKHPLVSVVIIAMMAILREVSGLTAIAKWAALKADFLASENFVVLLKVRWTQPRRKNWNGIWKAVSPASVG